MDIASSIEIKSNTCFESKTSSFTAWDVIGRGIGLSTISVGVREPFKCIDTRLGTCFTTYSHVVVNASLSTSVAWFQVCSISVDPASAKVKGSTINDLEGGEIFEMNFFPPEPLL